LTAEGLHCWKITFTPKPEIFRYTGSYPEEYEGKEDVEVSIAGWSA